MRTRAVTLLTLTWAGFTAGAALVSAVVAFAVLDDPALVSFTARIVNVCLAVLSALFVTELVVSRRSRRATPDAAPDPPP